MTPEELTEKMKDALPDGLRSVILYGSAAAGDHTAGKSDYNVLVITDQLGVKELNALSKLSTTWMREGNPAPLLFTEDRLKKSSDVFPIELLDIKQTHRVLHGPDAMVEISVSTDNLRLELEHELKGKLIQLRERYLTTAGKPKAVSELMMNSYSTFLVLFRAVLRLYEDDVPATKLDALGALTKHISFDRSVFEQIDELRRGERKPAGCDIAAMFETYLKTIEEIVDAVDNYVRSSK